MGWFSQELWALLKTRMVGTGLGWQQPGHSSHRSLGRSCTVVFPSSHLSSGLWLTQLSVRGSGTGTDCMAGRDILPLKYQFSILVLHAARVRCRPWYRYKLWIVFATLYWIPIVILYNLWWLSSRTDLVPNQVFLTQAKLSWTLLLWSGISGVILSTEILPA